MNLEKILTISGKPGLYKIVSQTRNGFIAQSLIDHKKVSVTLQSNISMLSEIAIYTLHGDKPIKDVFNAIYKKENGGPTPIKPKSNKDELEAYFFEVLPDYDEDRVYTSDIKKVIAWYNLLQEKNMLENVIETSTVTNNEEEE